MINARCVIVLTALMVDEIHVQTLVMLVLWFTNTLKFRRIAVPIIVFNNLKFI